MTPDETRIYLDHAATTPVDPAVVAAMLPYWTEIWGNPSSLYAAGRAARAALDEARAAVAAVLRCAPGEVILTSGGTEGDNLALKGVVQAALLAGRGRHLVTTAIEHHAILHTAAYLERFGAEATYLPVDAEGFVAPADVAAALRPDTCLVSVQYANNEIGAIEPLAEIAALTRARGIPLHTDAVQAAGSLPLDVDALGVDLLTIAAHKFYGPKGVGALYVRAGTPLLYQQQGGPQEGDRRGGTENVALAVGLAAALSRAAATRDVDNAHSRALRDRLIAGIRSAIPDVRLNGPIGDARLANNVNVAFAGVDGESLIIALDLAGVAASSGSACTTGATEPSHVLRAIGVPDDAIAGSLRLTVGRDNTPAQIEEVLALLPDIIARLRGV
ncbi:MAG TPA: cysteine desulfurase family protein [Thermomicrobiales bacterium]|nr:cysteine desulfurase family protein [Thermomicrobiales bacterium]